MALRRGLPARTGLHLQTVDEAHPAPVATSGTWCGALIRRQRPSAMPSSLKATSRPFLTRPRPPGDPLAQAHRGKRRLDNVPGSCLERHLGNHFLELPVLRAKIFDLVAGRFAELVARQLLLARFEEVFAPAVVQVGRDALASAQLRDALLTPQTSRTIRIFSSGTNRDEQGRTGTNRGELPPWSTSNLPHDGLCGLLLPRSHFDTLLGV